MAAPHHSNVIVFWNRYGRSISRWMITLNKELWRQAPTQAKAIELGRGLAKAYRCELIVKGKNGKIRSKDSYCSESPRKDTEH